MKTQNGEAFEGLFHQVFVRPIYIHVCHVYELLSSDGFFHNRLCEGAAMVML